MIFNSINRRRPRRASAEPTVPKGPSGAAPTGVRAARTRIRGIVSRKRIAPSARGRRKIRRRSAIATSPATSRHGRACRAGTVPGRTNRAVIGLGANSPKASPIVRGRRPNDSTSHAGARPIIARAEVVTSVRPSLRPGATNPRARRVGIDRGRTSHRETVAGARSRQAQASGPGTESRATASRGPANRRRPATGHGRPNPRALARSGNRGSASRQATRRAAIGRGPTIRQAVHRIAIDRGMLSGPRARSVLGPRSRQVRREAIGRGAGNRLPPAIENRGKRNRSDRAVHPIRISETAARTRASVATMNRPIATDAARCPRC
jgi:hypothetical protein